MRGGIGQKRGPSNIWLAELGLLENSFAQFDIDNADFSSVSSLFGTPPAIRISETD